jgi:hypothetical protein
MLFWGGISALVLIVAGVAFGFQLGTHFSVAMVALAGAAILYDTSNVPHHYPEDRHVAAALELFAFRNAELSALRGMPPPGQYLFDLSADLFPGVGAVAVFHQQFIVARVRVPDVRNDSQAQSLRGKLFRCRRTADSA